MRRQSVKRQAAVLACANGAVRALGFLLHVILGRMLGAEALGIFELAHSAHMLAVTPVTAGLPTAVSRLTARRGDGAALAAGRRLAMRAGLALTLLWLALSPGIAGLLGDPRTLPALWVFAPCVLFSGLGAVYHGFCYGQGKAWPPAWATLTEQAARFLLCAPLLIPGLTAAGRAAVPGAAETLGEVAALGVLLLLLRGSMPGSLPRDKALEKELLQLSLPLTGTRLIQTASRALLSGLLPRRLVAAGMPPTQATAAVGLLHGMVLPVIFLPGILTAAIGMAGIPALARREGSALRRMASQLFLASLGCGLLGWGAIHSMSGFLAHTVYNQPALQGLFRAAAPLTLLFALGQAAATLLSGLGQQKKTLLPTLAGTALLLLLTYRWAASPLRLYGAIGAMLVSRAVPVLWELAAALPLLGRDTAAANTSN